LPYKGSENRSEYLVVSIEREMLEVFIFWIVHERDGQIIKGYLRIPSTNDFQYPSFHAKFL
jgi:hypothetical protein